MSHIQLPQPSKNWIRRQRALDSLYAGLDSRLILVIAGAGYGKTGLLAQFAKTEGFTFSWLTLDEGEQDLRVFAEALVASLKHRFPGFGAQTMQLLTASTSLEQNIGLLVRTLVRELSAYLTQPLCMVLDDFHLVESSATVVHFVDRLLNELPDETHLIIASRNLPPLQLAMLIAQQQVAALGQSMLRLDIDETRHLIVSLNNGAAGGASAGAAVAEIDEDALTRIYNATEGWLVGLLMTTHIVRMREAQIGLGASRAVDLLGDYLMAGVWRALPPALQEFLFRSSVLDEISAPFCAQELGWADTAAWMQEVERRNLFIQVLESGDGNGNGVAGNGVTGSEVTYRYHPLFREFLLLRLREDEPLRYAQLQREVGAAHERGESIELAIRHYLLGGWGDDVMRLIETHAPTFLQRGRYRTILDWLSRLDAIAPGLRRERHVLWQTQIWALLNLGQDHDAMAALDQLDQLYQRTGDLGRRDSLHIRRGLLLYRANDFTGALASAQRVIRSIYPQPLWAQVEANRIAALCLYEQGRLQEALDALIEAERLTQSMGRSGYEALARVKLTRATVLDAKGETAASLRAAGEALTLAEEIRDNSLLAESLVDMAELLMFEGKLDGLSEMARQGLELADATGNQAVRIYGLSVLSLILLAQGLYDDALHAGESALTLSRQITASTERNAVLFVSLSGQAQALCRRALQEGVIEQRANLLHQALGLAREAAAIAEASQSARLRLLAYTRLGAVQVAQGDLDLARVSLDYAATAQSAAQGQFNNNAAGLLMVWRMLTAWDQLVPDLAQVEKLLKDMQKLTEQRRQTYFIQAEGDPIWAAYQALNQAPDLRRARGQMTNATTPSRTESAPGDAGISLLQHDLRVCGFGVGRVWRGDEAVTTSQWGWGIPRELFFYVLTARQVTRAQIAEVFWPEASSSVMQSSFHTAKFAVSKALGKRAMEYKNGVYTLHPELDVLYDVRSFEDLLEAAHESASAPAEALPRLLDAANLYQDDFLIDIDREWVMPLRHALATQYMRCCLDAGAAALAIGQPDVAIGALDTAAQRDLINEEVARMLMTVQWKAGKRSDALKAYQRLHDALQSEMGIRPDPETERLYKAIKGI
jgi:LuxR family maltose regulon positive regulatory protein